MSVKHGDVMTVLHEKVRLRRRGQLTIPREMTEQLGLHEDDILEARLEDGRIVLVPTVPIPLDQVWYWTEDWQREEHEVDEQVARRESGEPLDTDEALSVLDRLMIKDEQ